MGAESVKIVFRPFLLLEVLIALALVTLCVLPLIAPHIMMVQQEKAFVNELDAERIAQIIYANIVHEMYEKTIPWAAFSDSEIRPVTDQLLTGVTTDPSWPYLPFWKIKSLREKGGRSEDPNSYYLFEITVFFNPKSSEYPELSFPFELYVLRPSPLATAPSSAQNGEEKPPEEKAPGVDTEAEDEGETP